VTTGTLTNVKMAVFFAAFANAFSDRTSEKFSAPMNGSTPGCVRMTRCRLVKRA
jgi:hypothetical protein